MRTDNPKTLWNTAPSEWSAPPALSQEAVSQLKNVTKELADQLKRDTGDERVKAYETSVTDDVLSYIVR